METDRKNKLGEKSFKDKAMLESIRERVHRHLKDINSEITDEDLRNTRIELEVEDVTSYDIFQR